MTMLLSIAISINIETGKFVTHARHSSPFDNIRHLELVQTYADLKSSKQEVEFGHLSLEQALKKVEACSHKEYVLWQRYEHEEWKLSLSQTVETFKGHLKIVVRAQKILEDECKSMITKEKFPRGPQNYKDLTKGDIYTYSNSCLWSFVQKTKNKPKALKGLDLCRHMLQKIDHLKVQIEWMSVQTPKQLTIYKKQLTKVTHQICCNKSCLTCDGSSHDDCISCDTKNNRVLNSKDSTCSCDKKFFELVLPNCEKCPTGCLNCANKTGECKKCDDKLNFEYNETNKKCKCKDGHFLNEKQECQKCDSSCKSCQNAKTCTSCHKTRELQDDKTCKCIVGHYAIPMQQECDKCHYSCATCNKPIDSSASLGEALAEKIDSTIMGRSRCLVCVNGRTKEEGKAKDEPGQCFCNDCHYDNEPKKQCAKGHFTCLQSSGPSKRECTSCRENSKLTADGQCKENESYYPVKIKFTCGFTKKCHASCLTCEGPGIQSCLTCKKDKIFTKSKTDAGTCICKKGYMGCDGTCKPCHVTCLTCTSYESNKCTGNCGPKRERQNMKDEKGIKIHECKPVPGTLEKQPPTKEPETCSKKCKTCSKTADTCTECNASQKREFNKITSKCECIKGTFDNGSDTCIPCKKTDKTCNSLTEATSCFVADQDRELKNKECVCIHGTFQMKDEPKCQKCALRCAACKDAEHNCTKCRPNFTSPVKGSCICKKYRFYNKLNGYCSDCDKTCERCKKEGSTQCTSTEQKNAFVEGKTIIMNHIFVIPNNKDVNAITTIFKDIKGLPTASVEDIKSLPTKTIRAYIDMKVKKIILHDIETKKQNDIFSQFYYTPASKNPQQELFFKQPNTSNFDENHQKPDTTDGVSNIDEALKNIITKAEAQVEKYTLTIFVYEVSKQKTIENIKAQLDKLNNKKTKNISINVIEIFTETRNKDKSLDVVKVLLKDKKEGLLSSCKDLKSCDKTISELEKKHVFDKNADIDKTYYVFLVQNTVSVNGPLLEEVKKNKRFSGLKNKKDLIEYSLKGFENEWRSLNEEFLQNIKPLTVIYVQEFETKQTEGNIPATFKLDFPTSTKGKTPDFDKAIVELNKIIAKEKNEQYHFIITIIVDKEADLKEEKVNLLKKLTEKTTTPKIQTVNVIRLESKEKPKISMQLENLKETVPGDKTNKKDPKEFYEFLVKLPISPTLPLVPQNVLCNTEYYTNPKFVKRSDKYCLKCHKNCLTCTGPAKNQCISCLASNNREFKSAFKKCLCKQGFEEIEESKKCYKTCTTKQYRDVPNKVCKGPCHASCKKCVGPLKSDCSECKADEFLDTDKKCKKCNSVLEHCNKCKKTGTKVVCSECIKGQNRDLVNNACNCKKTHKANPITKKCDIICKDFQYRDEIKNTCFSCSPKCGKCKTSANNCIECSAKNNRIQVQNKCICKDSFYDDGSMGASCIKCKENCLTCKDKNTCLTCAINANMQTEVSDSGKCVCKAGFGMKSVKDQSSCEACHKNCKECNLAKVNAQCISCQPNRIETKTEDKGVTCGACKEGFTEVNGVCKPCDVTCKKCHGVKANECDACHENSNRTFNSATKTCSPNNHCFENKQKITQCCHKHCNNCSGEKIDQCTECYENFILNSKNGKGPAECVAVDYKVRDPKDPTKAIDCDKSCGKKCQDSSENACLDKCEVGRVAEPKNENPHKCKCNDKTFSDVTKNEKRVSNPFCYKCHYSCKTCKGPKKADCLSCTKSKDRLELNKDQCNCKDEFYDDGQGEKCLACPPGCKKCALVNKVLKCSLCYEKRQQGSKHLCEKADPYTYIPDKKPEVKVPLDCHYSCYKCDGPLKTNCTECSKLDGRLKLNKEKTCLPIEGNYDDGKSKKTIPCHYHCLKCTGPKADQCITCNKEKNFVPLGKTTCKAKDGTYDNVIQEKGLECDKSCKTCISKGKESCIVCKIENTIIKKKTEGTLNAKKVEYGLCEAKPHFYITEDEKEAKECSKNCKECKQTATKCTECEEGQALSFVKDTMNQCICKTGTFSKKETPNKCEACNNECLTCSSKKVCIKCKGQYRTINKIGKCVCISGFEADQQSINCRKPKKPSVEIKQVGEIKDDEACIVIKKVINEKDIDKHKKESGFVDAISLAQIANSMATGKPLQEQIDQQFKQQKQQIKKK